MGKLYECAEIYDLIESEQRSEFVKNDWKEFFGDIEIHTLLDVSIGSGGLTLPLRDLGIKIYGSDLSETGKRYRKKPNVSVFIILFSKTETELI